MLIRNAKYGVSGVLIGTFALFLSMFSFWAGPLSSPAHTVQEKAISWTQTIREVLFDDAAEQTPEQKKWNIDRVIFIAIPVLSAMAILFCVFSFIYKEPWRLIVSTATLAAAAMTFQFMATYIILLLLVIALFAIISIFFAA